MSSASVENVELNAYEREGSPDNKLSVPSNSNKNIKLFDAICLIYGCIVGSGIFISVSATFNVTQSESIGFVLCVWIVGGLVALLGGFCYVELGMRVPVSGGERSYYSIALSPKLSVVFTLIYVYLVKTITMAALGITAGVYLVKMFLPDAANTEYIQKIIGTALILGCMMINCISSKIATKSQTVLTILKSLALLIVIGSGIYYLSTGHTKDWKAPFDVQGFSVVELGVAFINAFFALEGWNSICFLLGEMKNPRRDLPIAMFVGIFSVLLFYLMTIISYSAVLDYSVARKTDAIGIEFSRKVLKQGFFIIPLLVFCSAAGALNGTLLSVSRVAMTSGHAKEIPQIFSLVDKKQRTPIFSIITMSLLSLVFLPLKFQVLLQSLAFVSWGFYFISTVCLCIFKFRPQFKPKTKIIQIPVVFVFLMQLACLFMIVMSFIKNPTACSIILGLILIIFFAQFIPRRYIHFAWMTRFHGTTVQRPLYISR